MGLRSRHHSRVRCVLRKCALLVRSLSSCPAHTVSRRAGGFRFRNSSALILEVSRIASGVLAKCSSVGSGSAGFLLCSLVKSCAFCLTLNEGPTSGRFCVRRGVQVRCVWVSALAHGHPLGLVPCVGTSVLPSWSRSALPHTCSHPCVGSSWVLCSGRPAAASLSAPQYLGLLSTEKALS